MSRYVLCAVLCGVSLLACSIEDSKPYPQTSGDGDVRSSEGDGGDGEGDEPGEGEGEGDDVEGEGEGPIAGEGEGEEPGPGEGEGEGEGPICACNSNADCQDGNFCNGAETCDCECRPGTPPDCADEFECTEDRCANNECVNVPTHARCGEGKICRPAEGGCVAPPPCRNDADCVPDDPCQTGVCEAATRSCAFAPFDGDEDGHPPIVCGGDDCDDSTGAISPDREEECNEIDDDCNGEVDEGFDLRTDRRNCGECGNECDADLICVNGNCNCRPGLSFCGERDGFRGEGEGEGEEGREICVDLLTSQNNCGQCGNQCADGAECRGGECACRDREQAACGGDCTFLFLDEENCGECGRRCPEGAECIDSGCRCPDDGIVCEGRCIWNDENNCEACGTRCAQGAECVRNQCVCVEYPLDNQWGDTSPCEGHCLTCDEPDRGLVCRRTDSDYNNCGACGRSCDGVYRTCNNGVCECSYLECNEVCVSPVDRDNCGRCGNRCERDERGVQLGCSDNDCIPCEWFAGGIITYCLSEGDAPNPDWSNVVCTNLNSDREHCGQCPRRCGEDELCVLGQCVPRRCNPPCRENEQCVEGQCRRCPDVREQFCASVCTNVLNDQANCGACGNICHGNVGCLNGNCTCPDETVDCDGECVNTQNDLFNCGQCGNACPIGAECQNGRCGDCVWTFDFFEQCNGACVVCGNGQDSVCTITATDFWNCGACGNACPLGSECQNGQCNCEWSWHNTVCDGACVVCGDMADVAGGHDSVCTLTATDEMNCGACGNRCVENQVCRTRRCRDWN